MAPAGIKKTEAVKMKANLKIAHLHVWDKNNKGDLAIVLAVQELIKKKFPGSRISDYSVKLLKEGTKEDAAKINQADIIIIGGGGIFYSYFLPYNKKFIAALAKPIIIFGAGYIKEVDAPEWKKELAQSVAFLAKLAKFIGVRDNNTKKFLIKNSVPGRKIDVVGDPAALLTEKKTLKIKPARKGVIRLGLNLNYSGWLGFGKWREDILASYRAAAEYFLKEYGGPGGARVEIYYLQHHPGEKNIYPELKIKNLKIIDLKPGEQKYVYGQLDLVIGMMLHAGVMAFGAGTPEISVAYDLRNYSFAEFIGHKELVVDLADLGKGGLLERVRVVFPKKEKYRKEFAALKLKIAGKQDEFLNKII